MFKGHKLLDNKDNSCPFGEDSTYLILSADNGNHIEAYELEGEAPMDLEKLILEA